MRSAQDTKLKKLNRLAGQIWKYIMDVRPLVERCGNWPDEPMDRDAKGESNPPFGNYAHLVVWVNRDASRKLRPLLDELEKHRAAYEGHKFDLMLLEAKYDSGAFGRWLYAQEKPYGDARRQKLSQARTRAFWELCIFVARALVDSRGEHVTLSVISKPKRDEDGGIILSPSERSDDVVADPRSIAPQWRTITAMDAYRAIDNRLARIREENPGMLEKDVEKVCQRELEELGHNGSIGRIRHAKAAMNKEREGIAA